MIFKGGQLACKGFGSDFASELLNLEVILLNAYAEPVEYTLLEALLHYWMRKEVDALAVPP